MKKKDNDKGPIENFAGQKHTEIELIKAIEKAVLSENHLDNIINNIGDPIFVKDENSNLTLVNDAFCALFEMERDDIIGKTLAEDVAPDEMEEFLMIDKQVLKTGVENINEESITIRDKPTRIISTRKSRYISTNNKKYLIGVIRDITEKKHAEKELKESEKEHRSLIAKMMNAFALYEIIYNAEGDAIDYKYLQVNPAWEKIVGSKSEMVVGKTIREIIPGIDDIWIDRYSRIVETGISEEFEEYNIALEKYFYCYAYCTEPGKFAVIFNDTTKKKKAENLLREMERKYQGIFDESIVAIYLFDMQKNIIELNQAGVDLLGYTREEMLKMSIPDTDVDPEAVLAAHDELLAGGRIVNYEHKLKKKDGSIITVLNNSSSITDDEGSVVGLQSTLIDVTVSRQAEEALKESEERIKLFTQNVPDFLLQIDRTGKINYVNKTLEGLTQEDVIGSSVYSWIPEGSSEKFKDKVEKVFRDGSSEIIEYPGNGLKSEPIWFESKIGPLEESGIITQVIIVSRDITERKAAESDLKRALNENIELKQQIEAENIYLKEELKLEGSFNEIVGSSISLRKVLKQVEQVASTDSTVLLLGETGTGKELIARAIHNASNRKDKPMVKVNCSALPENLIESELFGHEKGAFTGALNRKIGRFELANNGTIFLDEIGDLPIDLQSRLLRVLQESEFERVGGEKTIKVDVRVITATNRNLASQVLENKFRQDLYYRLMVFPITCPPLRDRIGDIAGLVHHFVNKYNHKVNNKIKTVDQKTMEQLMHYNWPGNIRELEHVIERAVIVNQGGRLRLGKWFMDISIDNIVSDELRTMETVERDYIIKVLEKTNWKIRGKNGAAEILGLKPTTLESRMKKMDIRK